MKKEVLERLTKMEKDLNSFDKKLDSLSKKMDKLLNQMQQNTNTTNVIRGFVDPSRG